MPRYRTTAPRFGIVASSLALREAGHFYSGQLSVCDMQDLGAPFKVRE